MTLAKHDADRQIACIIGRQHGIPKGVSDPGIHWLPYRRPPHPLIRTIARSTSRIGVIYFPSLSITDSRSQAKSRPKQRTQ